MLFVALTAAIVAACIGLIARLFTNAARPSASFMASSWGITKAEFATVSAVMISIIIPSTLAIGNKLSIDNIVRYEQYVNGVETRASVEAMTCYEGHRGSSAAAGKSNCDHTYVSDRYSWTETYYESVCNSKGECHSEMRTRIESANLYTPYATMEYTYTIEASMGKGGAPDPHTYPVALDANPVAFRRGVAIPGGIPRGAPSDWIDAKRRLDEGNPRPATIMTSYDNYILASGDEVLKTYAGQIDRYKSAGLLPDPTRNIMTDSQYGPAKWLADKVSFVGVSGVDEAAMQSAAMQFNAALGMQLQGDLHVVFVDVSKVAADQAETYTTALKAYWQSPVFGKRAIAKNAILVVIGVSHGKIGWARAQTGMPFGNEEMAQWIQDWLPDTTLDPVAIFGSPRTVIKPSVTPDAFTKDDVAITLSTPRGVLESIMFEKTPFKRARMNCEDGTCVGYKDLLSKIEPTGAQKTWMVVISSFLSLLLWWAVAATSAVDDFIARLRRSNQHVGSEWPRYHSRKKKKEFYR